MSYETRWKYRPRKGVYRNQLKILLGMSHENRMEIPFQRFYETNEIMTNL